MKDRKVLIYLLLLSTFIISMMALLVSAETNVNVKAKSSALYNPDTKSFLYQNNASAPLPLASTTKIITALIAIETLNPDEIIKIPKEAVGVEGSSLYLSDGDELTAKDLIYGVLLQSANDAATALALHVSGDISSFAAKRTASSASSNTTSRGASSSFNSIVCFVSLIIYASLLSSFSSVAGASNSLSEDSPGT